jgi:phosphomannomutase/phosphoglucomutase
MAKKPKAEPAGIPPHLRKPLLGAVGVIALAVGVLVTWQAFQTWRLARVEPYLLQERERLSALAAEQVAALRGRFAALVAYSYVLADLAAGEKDDAVERLRTAWPELTEIEFYESSLDTAFAGDLKQFGLSKLALMSQAHTRAEAVADLVGAGGDAALGLAAPVRDGDATLAIAYATAPLAPLIEVFDAGSASSGYLELRSGRTVLGTRGDASLAPHATAATAISGTSLQFATAAPRPQSMLSYSPLVQALIGLVALALGGVLLWRLRLAPGEAAAGGEREMTFGEVIQQEKHEPPKRVASERPRSRSSHVDRSIFRAYDIRGVVGQTLDEGVARLIGQAVGTLMQEQGLKEIVVGRDGRLSGPSLCHALTEGLRRAGCDVIDIGQAPTPVVYFATFHLRTGCGIAVTGSHNPPDYNGFKIVVGGETLSGQAIQDLYARIAESRLDESGGGGLQTMDIAQDYLQRVAEDIQLERRIKVVVDAGNGVAGAIAPQVLESIGAEVVPLLCEVDGEFPNHHPDPSDPHNLVDLITFVGKTNADLGIAFDGDGDRLGVVTRQGEIIYPDRVLMLFAQDVLSRNPGATVIYDVKCTGHLAGQILRHGGSPIMWKTGHSLIKAKMKETEAELAGEMSGHFFFRERWYGFDDGIYSAARLLEILAADERSPEEVFAELPKGVSTPELKIAMEEGEHYAYIEQFRELARFEGAKIATIDGVRADWPDGWGLVRCSNTTPSLVLRFDADTAEALARIQQVFRTQLLAVRGDLELPF